MDKGSTRLLILWLVFFFFTGICLAAFPEGSSAEDDPALPVDCLLAKEPLAAGSNEQFTINLMQIAAGKLASAKQDDLICLDHFLKKVADRDLSLDQHRQVLYLQAEVADRLDNNALAHQHYLELKLLGLDKAAPLLPDLNKKLEKTAQKVAADHKRKAFQARLQNLDQHKSAILLATLAVAVVITLLALSFERWHRRKYSIYSDDHQSQRENSRPVTAPVRKVFLPSPIIPPKEIVSLERMQMHDGRISAATMQHYEAARKKDPESTTTNKIADEGEATACLLYEGRQMIERLNKLAPYPNALLANTPYLNKLHYFWRYTLTGFAFISLYAAANVQYRPNYVLHEKLVGLFLLAALFISSLTCLRLMAKTTIGSLDEVVSMFEVSGTKTCQQIHRALLRIERDIDILLRSPWQFFIVVCFLFLIVVRIMLRTGTLSLEILPFLLFIPIILFIACPIIWMLIASTYVLNNICKMHDLAMNPLSPLKTMGLEKLTSVIGTFGLASSIVLTFGASIPIITSFIAKGQVQGWFWLGLIMPLLFFYWVYPYLKISSMVKQQKTERMQLLKTRILHIFNEWTKFEGGTLEKCHLESKKHFFPLRHDEDEIVKRMSLTQKRYLEPMSNYYEIFKKIDESPQYYLNLGSILELGKALGIPSLFALLSALLL